MMTGTLAVEFSSGWRSGEIFDVSAKADTAVRRKSQRAAQGAIRFRR
jgi:hypothetical protein